MSTPSHRQCRVPHLPPGHGKIQGTHLDRLAIVYVRQSTLKQVYEHQESGRLQYALKDRATALGWSPERVLVIDEDQGHSGASCEGRAGFQRLVAEVGLNHVGLVLGIEMSRLARSNCDWHQLLEICALSHTLIGDAEGVYDPRNYNDRLLLGLKGTMSEAELHILKQRLDAGKWAKARRGELGMPLPMGYVRSPSGDVVKDPDEQAQGVIDLVFAVFERVRTVNGVLQYLMDHQIQFPVRISHGPDTGRLGWTRPSRSTLHTLLHHPIYAGAYVYGRHRKDPGPGRSGQRRTGRTLLPMEEWAVCLKDRLPAYISWEQYERNMHQIAANRLGAPGIGVPRAGSSLLSGLLVCGRCGLRMLTSYRSGLRYVGDRRHTLYREPVCQSLAGAPVDAAVGDLVLQALHPLALDLSLRVAADLEAERTRLLTHWEQRLERARYESARAHRQYNAVEPENRLVARQLERQWETALQAEAALQEEYDRRVAQQPVPLTQEEREAIRRLAEDIPALWSASTTTAMERQAIVRLLIDQVVLTMQEQSEQVHLEITWAGGHQTALTVIRPVPRLEQLSDYPELVHRAVTLRHDGQTISGIAQMLTTEGWRPAHGGETFTPSMVRRLLARRDARQLGARTGVTEGIPKAANEWTTDELVELLDMPRVTLYDWIKKGTLTARRTCYQHRTVWLIWADENELARLRDRRAYPYRKAPRHHNEMSHVPRQHDLNHDVETPGPHHTHHRPASSFDAKISDEKS